MAVNFTFPGDARLAGLPDPAARPELFDGVLLRRVAAYLIDALCIGLLVVATWCVFAILTVLSLGAFSPALWFLLGLVPLAYHTLLVGGVFGGRPATLGMRALDVELRAYGGAPPHILQALAHAGLFYLTVGPTGGLILLVVLFNRRRRTLHDFLAGLVMLREPPAAVTLPG